MISAISSVSFRGETDNKDLNALINQPGKYSNSAQAAPLAPEADRADLSTKASKEKSNTGKVIGGTLAALALAWIGLGIAVGRKGSNWTKIDEPPGSLTTDFSDILTANFRIVTAPPKCRIMSGKSQLLTAMYSTAFFRSLRKAQRKPDCGRSSTGRNG